MRLPRDLSGDELARALGRLGYVVTRQTGSHQLLTTQARGEHHLTVPRHRALGAGTVAGILADVAEHFEIDRNELLKRLFA